MSVEDLEARLRKVCHELAMARAEIERLKGEAHPLKMFGHKIYDKTKEVERLRAERKYDQSDDLKRRIEDEYGVTIIFGKNARVIVKERR